MCYEKNASRYNMGSKDYSEGEVPLNAPAPTTPTSEPTTEPVVPAESELVTA